MTIEGTNEKNEKTQSLNKGSQKQDLKSTNSESSVSDQEHHTDNPEAIKPAEDQAAPPDIAAKSVQSEERDANDSTEDKREEEKSQKTPVDEDNEPKSSVQADHENEEVEEIITSENDTPLPDEKANSLEQEEKDTIDPTKVKSEEEAPKTPSKEDHNLESPELHEHPQEDSEHEEEHQLDYSNYNKKQIVQVLDSLLKSTDISEIGKILKEIKPVYDEMFFKLKDKAYKQYLEDGGEKDGFEYKGDDLDRQFHESYNTLKERRANYFSSQDKSREDNLKAKQALLEQLRQIVDSEETTASIADLKKIEQDWRNIGPVSPQHARSLWANFHALRNRFYDHRSIYFELKELDRNKNLKLKRQLIDKAEQLDKIENIKEAIRELNELHEEYKLLGPVPAEEQESLWQSFKSASDKIYAKRKHYYEELKEKFKINLVAKQALIEKIHEFSTFDSDRITEWNKKTKELLAIQKEWESIGILPKDKAKKINKAFWLEFKTFFNRKGHFFKKLEESRKENLEKKQELLKKAIELKESEDFDKTADALKQLQRQWREIGPVPIKFKDKVYNEFKSACDSFFNHRRKHLEDVENSYEDNLKKKEALCDELEKMLQGTIDLKRITEIEASWGKIGFVPKNSINFIQKRFMAAINTLVDSAEIPDKDKHIYKFKAQFSKMNYGPNADKFLQKKENTLRRQITKLENDINLWRNNLDFFAKSKTADKLRDEFNKKISDAEHELQKFKDELKVLNKI